MSRPRVLVLRAEDGARSTLEALAEAGFEPVHLPLQRFEPTAQAGRFAARAREQDVAWVVVTSARAVSCLGRPRAPVAAVGASTARALEAAGLAVALQGEAGAEELVAVFPDPGPQQPHTVLWPTGDRSRPTLKRGLAARGWRVEPWQVYRQVHVRPPCDEVVRALADLQGALFTSPSSVEALLAVAPDAPRGLPTVALGATTARELEEAGFRDVRTASAPAPRAMVAALRGEPGGGR